MENGNHVLFGCINRKPISNHWNNENHFKLISFKLTLFLTSRLEYVLWETTTSLILVRVAGLAQIIMLKFFCNALLEYMRNCLVYKPVNSPNVKIA